MTTWRDEFRAWAQQQPGRIWYDFGAQDLAAGLADCSGCVIEALQRFGKMPLTDSRGRPFDSWAQELADRYFPTPAEPPEPGDLVFYGADWGRVQHVVFYFGPLEIQTRDAQDRPAVVTWPAAVCGMWGGDSTTKGEMGRLIGAGFSFKKSPRWMRNLLGIRKVP